MIPPYDVATRADLLASGVSRRALARALDSGAIVRARRDRYLSPAAPDRLTQAVRVGGRLTCLSLLQELGVFVFANDVVHVHVPRKMSRLRSPAAGTVPLEPRATRRARLHWAPLTRPQQASRAAVGVVDALVHAVRCQPARHAIATLDSALNCKLIDTADLSEIFAALPAKHAVLRRLVDGRAQSGPETLARLIARALGFDVDVQVKFDGIGTVDLVLDGWLVVECDSKEFHADWAQQLKDRRRDVALAARGYTTLRVTAVQVMYHPDEVIAALRGLRAARSAGPHRRR